MTNISDEILIKKYFQGDEKSLEILIKRYLKPIYSFIYRYLEDVSEAEDATQETFLKAWRNLKKFNQEKDFKIWLFQIAKNTALDYLKKKKAIPFSEFSARGGEKGENIIAEILTDNSPLPAELFDKKQTAQMLNAAMKKLSPQYKMVLFLRYNDHFTFQEIANIFGESLNTVKSRHRRAILLLKKLLKVANK